MPTFFSTGHMRLALGGHSEHCGAFSALVLGSQGTLPISILTPDLEEIKTKTKTGKKPYYAMEVELDSSW